MSITTTELKNNLGKYLLLSATGSYTLVGTVVIKLSYQLSGEKQNEITKKLLKSL
ncbi:MAG: hypothetical protein HDT39_10570 [Lachnospiraceae bacterium]|nr:hypothetical protein [Lachnospiraceae bacterium]